MFTNAESMPFPICYVYRNPNNLPQATTAGPISGAVLVSGNSFDLLDAGIEAI